MSSPSLSEFLSQPEVAGRPRTSSATAAGVVAVSQACRAVAGQLGFGALRPGDAPVGEVNVHGEQQQALDVLAHGLFVEAAEGCSQFAGVLSEESEEVISADPAGTLLLAFDPLDGSSNLEINGPVGSIFSIVERTRTGPVTAEEFLGVGTSQVAAGYALYGSHTVLMVSVGDGVHAFTLGPATGQFRLSGSNVRIPAATQEYAINAANSRFWEPPVARYVAECCAGATGPRGKDFNTRWIAAVVSDTHRILTRGGVFLYPRDDRPAYREGRLRIAYEANPIAFLVEQAGGLATDGSTRILSLTPTTVHERVPFVFGSSEEVALISEYHCEASRSGSAGDVQQANGRSR